MIVTDPTRMNQTFAAAFNSRNVDNMLALYEPEATHVDPLGNAVTGLHAIRKDLEQLAQIPGTMTSLNNFCLVNADLALLRADWVISVDGQEVATGSTAELARRQPDGRWLYVIDHAGGASLPRVSHAAS